jgi:antitoxin component of MazEF toxin-antitoxin module
MTATSATATLSKWGNSQGVIIPKSICEPLGLSAGDKLKLSISEQGGSIEMTPVRRHATRSRKLSAQEVFVGWDGSYELPADLTGESGAGKECAWGGATGKELW